MGATIDLNSSGQFNLYVGAAAGAGNVDVLVDIQGYFDGQPSVSGFTPVTSRIYDSRVAPAVALTAGSITTVALGGVGGIPAGSASLAGVALNVETIGTNGNGYLRIWPGDQPQPTTSNIDYDPASHTSNLSVVRPSVADGTIKIYNGSTSTVNVVLDAEGYFTNPSVLPPAVGPNPTGSGSRVAAAMITHPLTDRIGAQINPSNGNLLITQNLLSVAGVGQSASVMMRYNALNDNRPTLSTGLFEAQLYRDGAGNIIYTGPDGAAYVFVPGGGPYSGKTSNGTPTSAFYGYSTPNGINASLYRVGAATSGPGVEYDLTFHPSQTMNVYVDNGSNLTLNSSQDVTGANHLSYTYAGGKLTTQTDTQGRTISYAYTDPNNPTQASTITDNSLGRTITLTYSGPAGALSKIVDATGAQTLFAYNAAGNMSSITDGRGKVTAFTYDTGNRLLTLTAASGTATPSVWTMTYPSTAKTTMADPNSHTQTYNLTGVQVTSITDPNGNTQSSGYNSHNDLTTAKSGYNDQSSYAVATSTYNLMSITSPQGGQGTSSPGRTQTYQYPTSPTVPFQTADFRPMSVTDTNSSTTTYTYNGFGEAVSAASMGAAAGTTTHTYQGDDQGTPSCGGKTGQLCRTTDGNGNVTAYTYNTAGNLVTMTPPAPLGAHTFSYDAAGRKITETDGRGNTATTCYDNDDRILQVSYSTGCGPTSGVSYVYDAAGNLTGRATQSTGTSTTWTYDDQNRPTQEADSSGTTTAAYDPAGNVVTYTDGAATTTYTYDGANNLLTLAEPGGSCPTGATTLTPITTPNTTKCTGFTYNKNNQRNATYLPNGVQNSVVQDASGRIVTVIASRSGVRSVDRSYAYDNTGTDSGVLRTFTDNTASTNTNYTYDPVNRLAADTVKTGTTSGSGTTLSSDGYSYDKDGNLTQQITAGATTHYGYTAADQMCWSAATTGTGCTTPTGGTTYTYDGNGNTLTGDASTGTNTWTAYNQLSSSTVGGTQTYTYQGTTNTQRITAGSTTFANGLLGQITHSAAGAANQQYVRDPKGALIALQTGGTSYYYTTDNLGSILQLTDPAGNNAATYKYGPYGQTLTATGPQAATNPYRYAGGYTDTTGLIKYGARYYNPTHTRFTQPDPSGQETNNYTYTGDNPTSNTDINGLSFWEVVAAVAVGVVVGVASGGLALPEEAILATTEVADAVAVGTGVGAAAAVGTAGTEDGYDDGWSQPILSYYAPDGSGHDGG